jgi:hypothetical protein
VLASPRNVDAHVTALYGLLAAAADGSLRSFVPAARRVSISQLRCVRARARNAIKKPVYFGLMASLRVWECVCWGGRGRLLLLLYPPR